MTNSLLRMPGLSDGISGIDDWVKTIPQKIREASLDLCKVTIRQNAARPGIVFSVPDSAVEHLRRRGGEIEDSESLDDGDETFPFSKLQSRLLLGTARSASPPNARLILIEDENPGAFSDLLSALSTIRSTSQEILVFESASKGRIPGIRLTGVEPHDLDGGILGSARSLQIRDLGFDVATPTGFIHPMAEACPELIRIQNPKGDLLLWNSNPSDEQRGAFVPLSVLERRRRQPADYFRITPELFIDDVPENDVSPDPIDIRLVKLLDRKQDDDRRKKQIILELQDPTGTRNIRRLLDTMDETESGLFDTEARIWTSREGKSAAGLTTHRILFRTESPLAEIIGPDVRGFVQPSAFEAMGIPLFVELGHRLHPAADAFIDELPIDHPLARQFTEMFPAESDGRDCHHLLRMNPHGMPSHHVLRGGELLRDHIGPIVAETIALPPDTSIDSKVCLRLAESIRSARDRNLENIRTTGEAEAEAVIGEFDEVLAELSRHVDQLERQLDGSASKAKVLTEVATHLETELAKSPGDWWRIDALVGRLNNDIIKPREEWVAKLDSSTRQFEVGQKAVLSQLADAAAIVEDRLGLIRGWVKTSEAARSALQRSLDQAANLQQHLKRTAAKSAEDHANATAMLVSVSQSIEAEDRRLQSSEDRLRKKKAALEDQQRKLSARRAVLQEGQRDARQTAARLDTEYDELFKNEAQLDAELRRLAELKNTTIPELRRQCDKARQRIAGYDIPELEARERSLAEDLRALESDESKIQEREAACDRTETEQSDRRTRLEDRESALEEQESKANQVEKSLDGRERNLDRRRKSLERRTEEIEARRDRQERDEAEIDREERAQDGGVFSKFKFFRWGGRK